MFDPWVGKIPWRRILKRTSWTEEPGGLHSPWGRKQSDTTEVTKQQPEETPSPLLSGHQLSGHGRQSVVAPGESEVIPL